MFLKFLQNLQEIICARVSFLIKKELFIKRETLAQVFSSEFSKIFKKTFFTEHDRTTASGRAGSVPDLTHFIPLVSFSSL